MQHSSRSQALSEVTAGANGVAQRLQLHPLGLISRISLDTRTPPRDTDTVDNRGSPCDRAGSLTAPARSSDPNR